MDFSSVFILIIIVFFLFYSFFKTRKKQKVIITQKKSVLKNNDKDYEKHVITAVLASLMNENKYIIKRIYQIGSVNEKKSSWKISGRQESINTRLFFKKNR